MKKTITILLFSVFSLVLIAQSKYVSPKTITFEARFITQEYEVVRIGEYEWVNKNFHHNYTDAWLPGYQDWFMHVEYTTVAQLNKLHDSYHLQPNSSNPYYTPTITLGSKRDGGYNKAESEKMLPDGNIENIKAKNFDYWYGAYYFGSRGNKGAMDKGNGYSTGNTVDYMHFVNQIPSGSNCSSTTNWQLPTNDDIRQLLAMCSFKGKRLDAIAARQALGARRGENPFAYDIPAVPGGNPGYKTYWFETSTNELGFNLMPAGQKFENYEVLSPGSNGYKEFKATKGDFQHLYYTATFPTQDGNFVLHDFLTFYEKMDSNRRYNVRWCRRLTPEELGYNIWVRRDRIGRVIDITDTKATTPCGTPGQPQGAWSELEPGYLRGFYVKYMLDKPNSSYKLNDLLDMVIEVDEETVGIDYHYPAPSTYSQRNTRLFSEPVSFAVEEKNPTSVDLNLTDNNLNINTEQRDELKFVSIYSIYGNIALQKSLSGTNQTVNVSRLKPGVYLAEVLLDSGVRHTQKLLKK